MAPPKKITIRYFALVGPRQLLEEIKASKAIPLTTNIVRAIINDEFADWEAPIHDGDQITLIPPFSGG